MATARPLPLENSILVAIPDLFCWWLHPIGEELHSLHTPTRPTTMALLNGTFEITGHSWQRTTARLKLAHSGGTTVSRSL